ncbi:FadR/GntR family transcriptional regulator [Sphingomonas colocasiae]|uniref:GntR family transcriptional regulator n=1 Tax=Sphingomonas colocasiae TaxID=1848973 RepID=A0ABS7PTI4_9SPHN|nr:GntR family transcriptional regulator [Sphingomonas colocasiae]MBY8824299.1 GntR family transcriptional regulator [Sphingomonas colocasiae]
MAARLFVNVCASIRHDIRNGKLKPGDKLPSERELAETLGVGRPVVREALRSLEEAGILQFRRGITGGAFVSSGDTRTVTRSITDLIFLGAISLDNITEARTCLLRFAAELAAERGTDADFDALEANIDEAVARRDEIDLHEKVRLVGSFHDHLGRAAHNEALVLLIHSVTEVVAQILLKTQPEVYDLVIESRRRLVTHLRARDREAAAAEVTAHQAELHAKVVDRARQLHTLDLTETPTAVSS